jgi:hypothetical protein
MNKTPSRPAPEGRGVVDEVDRGSALEALGAAFALVLLAVAVTDPVAVPSIDLVTLAVPVPVLETVELELGSNTATGSINHCISRIGSSVLETANPPLGNKHAFNAAKQNPNVEGRYSHF